MVCFPSGSVSIFDPFTVPKRGLSSEWEDSSPGAWLVTLTTTFTSPSSIHASAPCMIEHQQILDAEWTAGGRSIIALLTNGQLGIWDRSAPLKEYKSSDSCNTPFAFSAYLTSTLSSNSQNSYSLGLKKPRGSRSSVAPMTPQTRGTKSATLFRGGDEELTTMPAKGGLSVTPYSSISEESTDDYVTLWYDEAIYTILSLRTYRTKKTGSLFGAGPTEVGLQSLGERLSSASILPLAVDQRKKNRYSCELVSKHFDMLVATETRLHFLVTEPSRVEIANATEDKLEESIREDQALLARGALDLGGVDRMLNSMTGSLDLGKERERREDSVVVIASPIKKLGWGQNEVREFSKEKKLM